MKKIAYHPSTDLAVQFDARSHTYVDDYDISYTSATTFISQFFVSFNAKEKAWGCSKKAKIGSKYFGMSPDKILMLWEKKGDQARLEGSVVHEYAEWLVSGGTSGSKPDFISERTDALFRQVEKCVSALLNTEKFKFVAAEMIVFSPGIGVAGMIDLLMWCPVTGDILILDWKQNEKITRDSMFGNALFPIHHLSDDDYNHYALQLSLYRYLMECNGYFPGYGYRQYLLHITPKSFKSIHVPYLRDEIQKMVVEWKKKK